MNNVKNVYLTYKNGKTTKITYKEWKEQKGKNIQKYEDVVFAEIVSKVPDKIKVPVWNPKTNSYNKKPKTISTKNLINGGLINSIGKEKEVIGIIGPSNIHGAKCLDTAAIKVGNKHVPVKDIQVFYNKLNNKDKKVYHQIKFGTVVKLTCTPVVVYKVGTKKFDVTFSQWKNIQIIGQED